MSPGPFHDLLYEVDADRICWITLNRPEKLNAMSARLATEMGAAMEAADRDPAVNVIVLRGAGRGFCSGHDLTEDAEDDFATIYDYRNTYAWQQEDFTAPWRIGKPVISSIHYCAIGKGFELALFTDITIITSDCRLGYKEARYGIAAMNMVLPYVVGMKAAKDLLLTGREVDAQEALAMGLVTQVVEPDELAEATLKKARMMARMPQEMQRAHKQYLNRVYEMQGLKTATDYYQDLMTMLSFCPVPEYEEFQRRTNEDGLRAALEWANGPFEGLDD